MQRKEGELGGNRVVEGGDDEDGWWGRRPGGRGAKSNTTATTFFEKKKGSKQGGGKEGRKEGRGIRRKRQTDRQREKEREGKVNRQASMTMTLCKICRVGIETRRADWRQTTNDKRREKKETVEGIERGREWSGQRGRVGSNEG